MTKRIFVINAARYAARMDAIESGTHNNHPGLSSEDIIAWEFAGSKAAEHIAVSKVDTGAVVDIRIKEAEVQNRFLSKVDGASGSESGLDASIKNRRVYWRK